MHPLVSKAKKDLATTRKNRKFKKDKFIGTSTGILSISVTSSQISRALKFWDKLIRDLELVGFKIGHKQYYGTVAVKDGIELPIRVREKCRRVKRDDSGWGFTELEPIGKLVFTLDTLQKKEWEDTKNKPLELKTSIISKYLEKKVQEEIELQAEIEARKREYEANKKAREEMELRKHIEEQKFKDLMTDCEKWHQANRLRKYINTIKMDVSRKRFSSTFEKDSWLEWASKKADEVDPLISPV
jgi:hypothetical protein